MEDKGLRQLTVTISGRSYPLKVKEGEEDLIQDLVEELNQTVQRYQKTYVNKDKQDCLSMALLTYAFDLKEAKYKDVNGDLASKINELETMLEQMLKDD